MRLSAAAWAAGAMIGAVYSGVLAQDAALPDDHALLDRAIIVEGERPLRPDELEAGLAQMIQHTGRFAPGDAHRRCAGSHHSHPVRSGTGPRTAAAHHL